MFEFIIGADDVLMDPFGELLRTFITPPPPILGFIVIFGIPAFIEFPIMFTGFPIDIMALPLIELFIELFKELFIELFIELSMLLPMELPMYCWLRPLDDAIMLSWVCCIGTTCPFRDCDDPLCI